MPKQLSEDRCQFIRAEGKGCRMRRSDAHDTLCTYHARQEEKQRNPDPEALAAELLGPVKEFNTSASVNYVLGKLLRLVVTQRITSRDAAVTAYICQLLLQSIPRVKNEIFALQNEATLEHVARQAIENLRQGVIPVSKIHNAKSVSVPPAPPAVPPVIPPVYQEKSGSPPPAVSPTRPAPPTESKAVTPLQPEKSDSVPPAAPAARPPKPQPFGLAPLPRPEKFRH